MGVLSAATIARAQTPGAQTPASPKPAAAGAPLKVATVARQPFAIKASGTWAGFSIGLWQEIAKDLGRETTFVEVATFPDMLKMVERGQVDAAIANITITAEREKVLDFTHPIFDAGLQVMVRTSSTPGGLVGAIFNWEMLGLVLLAGLMLFIIANLMWFFERKSQPYFDYPYKEGIWRSFWWALNLMLNGGFEERVPQTRRGRVFAVILVIASLFVVSAFVAKITAALTVGELKNQIQGYRDLYGRRVGTTTGSTSAAFLTQHAIRFRGFASIDAMLAALENGQIDAVVHDAPILAYYEATQGRGKVHRVGGLLRPEKYGIALPTASPLAEPINRAILRLRENGTYDRLVRSWFGENYR